MLDNKTGTGGATEVILRCRYEGREGGKGKEKQER
jgi:hypothetical protein